MFEILPADHSDAKIRARLLSIKAAGHVRLDEEEIEGLVYALAGVPAFRISLFGSRTQPDRRGGDIDILLLTDTPPITVVQQVAVRFFFHCEEKIDVVAMNPNRLTPKQSDFLSCISPVDIVP